MATSPAGKKPAPKSTTKPADLTKAAGKAAPARKSPAPTKKTAPPQYDREKAVAAVLEELASGHSLIAVCKREGLPSFTTFMRWLAEEGEAGDSLRDQYARAREAQAEVIAEDILAIADEECTTVRADKHGTQDDDGHGNTEVVFDSTAVQRNRLRVDARKWLLSKLAPKKYGDKLAVGGADDLGPVQTVNRNLTDAERAVRLSRAINDNPAAMQALLAAMVKKDAAK